MAAEHCSKKGHDQEILTTNYKLRTTPKAEWELVVARKGRSAEEFARILEEQFPTVGLGEGFHGRRIPDVVELMRLDSSIRAELAEAEVIVIILYTGPMVRASCDGSVSGAEKKTTFGQKIKTGTFESGNNCFRGRI